LPQYSLKVIHQQYSKTHTSAPVTWVYVGGGRYNIFEEEEVHHGNPTTNQEEQEGPSEPI